MRTYFTIYTTVDITETKARKGDDSIKYNQQQNFLTICNTIALRVNPIIEETSFISTHKTFDKEKVWQLDFYTEYEGAIDIDTMIKDFMYVPFVDGLDETKKFTDCVFITSGKNKNIIFEQLDK